MTRRRSPARFFDPTGARFGVPTWPWRMAPPHLRTRRQLAAEGLRPGGQPVAGQVLWNSRRYNAPGGVRAAYLYDIRLALPKRTPSERQRVALGRALAARRHCPSCRRDAGYVLPRHLGECLDCAGIAAADPDTEDHPAPGRSADRFAESLGSNPVRLAPDRRQSR